MCSVVLFKFDKSLQCDLHLGVVMLSIAQRQTSWWSTLEIIRGELFPKPKLIADPAGNVMADEGTADENLFIIHSLCLVFTLRLVYRVFMNNCGTCCESTFHHFHLSFPSSIHHFPPISSFFLALPYLLPLSPPAFTPIPTFTKW